MGSRLKQMMAVLRCMARAASAGAVEGQDGGAAQCAARRAAASFKFRKTPKLKISSISDVWRNRREHVSGGRMTKMPFGMRAPRVARAAIVAALCWMSALSASARDVPSCPAPEAIGPAPTRLLVIVPATTQGAGQWQSFLQALRKDPQSVDLAVLVFDHHVGFMSLGSAYDVASQLEACIAEKAVDERYRSITLIGHSIGGMFVRKAYLSASGAAGNARPAPGGWAERVDRILLFTSVNKGLRDNVTWWSRPANWLLRSVPHPHFVLEDLALGSDFIADVRIAWIRHFGKLADGDAHGRLPRVVQFWGTEDSVVQAKDNADLEAFNGPVVVQVPGARHGDLQRLEPEFAQDPAARWKLFNRQLFGAVEPVQPPAYSPRRVLFIVRGIRDSSNSDWVSDLRTRALKLYGEGNVEDPEYGYFSAAQFALRPFRAKNIPSFRDLYAQRLAENPLTEFDLIAHSNGTYIFGQSVLSTPSMRFKNVALAAPVLPTDFEWSRLFRNGQVERVRYDTANLDWPVGILCPALRALGFSDVGPAGLVLFGDSAELVGSQVKKVGWYDGGHGAALRLDPSAGVDNRAHLLNFVHEGVDVGAGEKMSGEGGWMPLLSRATPYVVWLAMLVLLLWLVRRYRAGHRITWTKAARVFAALAAVYVILDVV